MKHEFVKKDNWILPTWGSLGNKAKNLLENSQTIGDCGWKIPKSLVIPYEYFIEAEGPLFYILDWINENFEEQEKVVVRSNAPDEDLIGRTPGLYNSVEIEHKNRGECYWSIESVIGSYFSGRAKSIRKKAGLKDKGMSLLIQEKIDADCSGCFSDLEKLALLTFTDAEEGINAMQKPSIKRFQVYPNGKIVGERIRKSYNEYISGRLRELVNSLPKLEKEKGWEIEFVINPPEDFYVVQTTPIKKGQRFEVKETEDNIFYARNVLGSGEFNTEGILYTKNLPNLDVVKWFDKTHKNYALATTHQNLCLARSNVNYRILNKVDNAQVIFLISDGLEGLNPFAAHVETYIREGERTVLQGEFTNKWKKILLGGNKLNSLSDPSKRILYSHSRLNVQVDEAERRYNVRLKGDAKDFGYLI